MDPLSVPGQAARSGQVRGVSTVRRDGPRRTVSSAGDRSAGGHRGRAQRPAGRPRARSAARVAWTWPPGRGLRSGRTRGHGRRRAGDPAASIAGEPLFVPPPSAVFTPKLGFARLLPPLSVATGAPAGTSPAEAAAGEAAGAAPPAGRPPVVPSWAEYGALAAEPPNPDGIEARIRPAIPSAARPVATGLAKAKSGEPSRASRPRQPVGRSRAASAAVRRKSWVRCGAGSRAVADAMERRSARSSAQAGQSATWACATITSRVVRSWAARRATSVSSWSGRTWGRNGTVLRRPQPRNSSIRSSSRPRRLSRPRWIRDLTVPSDTPVISAISA